MQAWIQMASEGMRATQAIVDSLHFGQVFSYILVAAQPQVKQFWAFDPFAGQIQRF
jgi:hypothetical protein